MNPPSNDRRIDPQTEGRPATYRLSDALGELCYVCGHSAAFVDLAERWFEADDSPLLSTDQSPNEELGDRRSALAKLMTTGRRQSCLAIDAISDGGAVALDEVVYPNEYGQPRSLQVGLKLERLSGLLAGHLISLRDPRTYSEKDVQELRAIGRWLGIVWDEIAAICRMYGPALQCEGTVQISLEPIGKPSSIRVANRTGTEPIVPVHSPTVVMWEGALHTDRNIRLARTRTAYLEANGKVSEALAALEAQGHRIGRSTFYDQLKALDNETPGWR